MFIVKLILFPLWPIFIGWKLSSGMSATTSDGGDHPFLGRLVGTVLIAGGLYYGVFWVLMRVTGYSTPSNSANNGTETEPAPSAEVAK